MDLLGGSNRGGMINDHVKHLSGKFDSILAVTRASHGAFPYESSLPVNNLSKLEKS